jgi:alcohol dehydrogenase
VTICGIDLHILKGDVPTVDPGRVLGHEAVGTVVETGVAVTTVRPGDQVLVSCISSCGRCRYCRNAEYGQCLGGGDWILGHSIDGVQAEFARVPFADTSTSLLSEGVTGETALMLAAIMPTSYEVGARKGRVQPGDTSSSSARDQSAWPRSPRPSCTVAVIDREPARLAAAKSFGADVLIQLGENAATTVAEMTGGLGADVVIEAVGRA